MVWFAIGVGIGTVVVIWKLDLRLGLVLRSGVMGLERGLVFAMHSVRDCVCGFDWGVGLGFEFGFELGLGFGLRLWLWLCTGIGVWDLVVD